MKRRRIRKPVKQALYEVGRMVDYSVGVIPESQVSLDGGTVLDGITQGDGSHLIGATLSISGSFTILNVRDAGADSNFDDNDNNQLLDGDQTLDGVLFTDGTRIEAEYQFEAQDSTTGQIYRIIGVNIVNSSPAYATVEGLAFVGDPPPGGTDLIVISAIEGPGSSGQPSVDVNDLVTCFAGDTRILTPSGLQRITEFEPGAVVLNRYLRPIPIRWMIRRHFGAKELMANPKLRPVRIEAGALGNGLPKRDLLVSRQHRMLIESKIAMRMFGQTDILVSAIKLTELPGIYVDYSIRKIEYVHLLFDQHEILFAEFAPSESLFIGTEAMKSFNEATTEEILMIFPEIQNFAHIRQPACYIPSGKKQRKVISRHKDNRKPLLMQD